MLLGALGALEGWSPPEVVLIHSELWFAILSTLHVLLNELWSDTDDVLSLPILHHIEGLEGADDILVGDTG